jgi:hypothetical protein
MELIKPRQISGDIMTLIEEADQKVIIITPYFKVKNWYKMLNSLNSLITRNIAVEIYVRENEIESIKEVRTIGIEPITIPNLHAKLYLNEKMGIVSSMNMLYSSDTNSLDIAVKTENDKEYKALWDYYLRYIKKAIPEQINTNDHFDWKCELDKQLFQALGREANITESRNQLQINTGNRYEVFIKNMRTNELKVVGILSGKEYEYSILNPLQLNNARMKSILIKGGNRKYDTICGVISNLKTKSVDEPLDDESRIIVDGIVEFISAVELLKKRVR